MFVHAGEKKRFIDFTLRKKGLELWYNIRLTPYRGINIYARMSLFTNFALLPRHRKVWFSVSDVIESTIDRTCSRNMK